MIFCLSKLEFEPTDYVKCFFVFFSFRDYVISYDTRNRTAHWVFEHLTKESVRRNDEVDRTKSTFMEDKSLHPFFRSSNLDYKVYFPFFLKSSEIFLLIWLESKLTLTLLLTSLFSIVALTVDIWLRRAIIDLIRNFVTKLSSSPICLRRYGISTVDFPQ